MPRVHHGNSPKRRGNSGVGGSSIFSLSTPFSDGRHYRNSAMTPHHCATSSSSSRQSGGNAPTVEQCQFRDGMEEYDGNDSNSSTTLGDDRDANQNTHDAKEDDDDKGEDDGSVDLLMESNNDDDDDDDDDNDDDDDDDDKSILYNHRNKTMTMKSPLSTSRSPATQTLDRLSQMGSQECGAELCIHLLAVDDATTDVEEKAVTECTAVTTEANVGSVIRSDERLIEGRGLMNSRGAREEGSTEDGRMYKRQQCLRSLKEYFMSTKNSSTYATQLQQCGMIASPTTAVPFCHRCNSQSSATIASVLPHHGLCPHHALFYNSGSYEILNLIVDGNLLNCEACVYQFEHGRLNKDLCHIDGCERKKKVNGKNKSKKNLVVGDVLISSSAVINGERNTRSSNNSQQTPSSFNNQGSQSAVEDQGPMFEAGTIVFVQDRTWSGRNDLGGVARIIKVHPPTNNEDDDDEDDDDFTYDVKYVLEARREKHVEERFLSLHTEYMSPANLHRDLGVVDSENNDNNGIRISVTANMNVISTASTKDATLACVAEDGNREAAKGAGDNIHIPKSPAHVDASGRPLSEYERLRQRNIERNKSRLAQLGLLDNPDKVSKSSSGMQGKKRKARHGDEVERRTQPKRQSTVKPSEDDGMSSVASTAATSVAPATVKAKCAATLTVDQQSLPTTTVEEVNSQVQRHIQPRLPHGTSCSTVVKANTVSLVDAARAGCRKCTLEWQTERTDPKLDHDVCCPRGGKKAPCVSDDQNTSRGQEVRSASMRSIDAIASRVQNHATPSPVPPPQRKNVISVCQPPPPLPTLPSWIKEFVSESNRHNETIPVPRGSKWLPCPNPWGKIGHEDGDFVIISPFESESTQNILSIFHQGPNGSGIPKRFIVNPFDEGSPYLTTHRSPARGGYCVLRLLRDRTSLRPWGFTFRLHEFGGACLIDSVEAMSPAEAAEDVSGWNDQGASTGLKVHDMIICINGKSIGSMTLPELQIEVDVCGSEMLLVVSRFDIQETDSLKELTTLVDLAMDWSDIGAGAILKTTRVSFEDDRSSGGIREQEIQMNGGVVEPTKHVGSICDSAGTGPHPSLGSYGQAYISKCLPVPAHQTVNTCVDKTAHPPLKKKSNKFLTKQDIVKGAASGCKKCKRQLETSVRDKKRHCLSCPNAGGKKEVESSSQDKIMSQVMNASNPIAVVTVKKRNSSSKYYDSDDSSNDSPPKKRVKKAGREPNDVMVDPLMQSMALSQREEEAMEKLALYLEERGGTRRQSETFTCTAKQRPCGRYESIFYNTDNKRFKSMADVARSLDLSTVPLSGIFGGGGGGSAAAATTKKKPVSRYQKQLDELSNDGSDVSSGDERDDFDDDENPWLGCVCGNSHPNPIKVFWIQCELCDAWYNVAEECVGFNEEAAGTIDKWCCWACNPPVAGLGL